MQIHGDAIRCGVHSGQQYTRFEHCLELWQHAEELGYDWVSHFDHFRPPDRPTGPCFEGMTLLSALAARTNRVRCGMLVLAIPYRHPAIVANAAASIDHVSNGRLELGLGLGASDLGQDQYDLEMPPIAARIEMLREACTVMRNLWNQETTTFEGRHYRLKDARLEPKPVQGHLPLVIGGAGERGTLRIVAEHADIWNTFSSDLDSYAHKLEVLASHCSDIGRSPADIRKSLLFRAVLAEDPREAERRLDDLVGHAPADSPLRRGWLVVGTAEQCIERLFSYRDRGVGDFLLGVRSPVDWETLEIFARAVAPVLRGRSTS